MERLTEPPTQKSERSCGRRVVGFRVVTAAFYIRWTDYPRPGSVGTVWNAKGHGSYSTATPHHDGAATSPP